MGENVKKKVGRPSTKQKNIDNETKTNSNSNENVDLIKKIEAMEQIIAQLRNEALQKNVKAKNTTKDDDYNIIRPDRYIKVMSLNFGQLNLTTMPRGQGKVFTFNKFGDVRNIVYSDVSNIIHNHQKFAEEGRFYVFNKQVIENHGLIEFYEKFLTKEKIEQILDMQKDEMINLFNSATKTQQDTIVQIIIKKIKQGEDIDLNKVDILSRLTDQNIYEIANEYKQEE
jgi:hypothetical protein